MWPLTNYAVFLRQNQQQMHHNVFKSVTVKTVYWNKTDPAHQPTFRLCRPQSHATGVAKKKTRVANEPQSSRHSTWCILHMTVQTNTCRPPVIPQTWSKQSRCLRTIVMLLLHTNSWCDESAEHKLSATSDSNHWISKWAILHICPTSAWAEAFTRGKLLCGYSVWSCYKDNERI